MTPKGNGYGGTYGGQQRNISAKLHFATRYPSGGHRYLVGAPHRAPHLAKALDYIRGHGGVWFARGG
jgi:hypothetical protein